MTVKLATLAHENHPKITHVSSSWFQWQNTFFLSPKILTRVMSSFAAETQPPILSLQLHHWIENANICFLFCNCKDWFNFACFFVKHHGPLCWTSTFATRMLIWSSLERWMFHSPSRQLCAQLTCHQMFLIDSWSRLCMPQKPWKLKMQLSLKLHCHAKLKLHQGVEDQVEECKRFWSLIECAASLTNGSVHWCS